MLITRKHYDAICEAVRVLGAVCEDYKGHLKSERARFDTLLANYHALKLSGAAVPDPKPEPRPIPEPDIVTQAIIQRAGTSKQLRKQYAEFVTEQRREGVSDDEIAHAILTGVDDDAGVPG